LKRKPTHPGVIIKKDYLEPLSINIKDMSLILGVSKKILSEIIDEKASISPEMAFRLSRAFDTTPELWMNLQINYDLWLVENTSKTWQFVQPVTYTQW